MRDLPDTILVWIISGTLCAMRITILGLNPEGFAQYFSGIEKCLWRLCRSLTWINALRPGALLSLSRYLACFVLQSTEKGFSALKNPQSRRCQYEDEQSLSLVMD